MNIDAIIMKMSLRDKIALCSGADFWHTKAMSAYGVPALMVADGPHGLRKQEDAADMLGVHPSVPATCFPTAVSTACSWYEKLLGEIGEAVALEAAANGVGVILGPGANIKRNPLCGRSFEYISEDPYLTGKLAAAYIKAAEATGIGCSLKHFACNNQEYKRFSSDSVMDERTLREIYLAGFEMAVREGKPSTVMSAYNKVNGAHCSDNKMLLTDILRDEWGFGGMVMTDWGGMSDRIRGFVAGCDLVMPGGAAYMEAEARQAVADGTLEEAEIDRCAKRVIRLVFDKTEAVKKAKPADMERHHALARRAAEESAVLMKNEGGLLPLSQTLRLAFIGHMAKHPRYQGSGSSLINPWKLTSAVDAYPDAAFAPGCHEDGATTEALLAEAVTVAQGADVAVVFVGLPDMYESEGFDRDDMKMPDGHMRLIEAVANANHNTVVVLCAGSVVETPWSDRVKAVLYMGLSGQAGGEAVINLLLGRAVPCGKLAESWPAVYEDCISASYYASGKKDAHYREGVYVGYRYYVTAGQPIRFPFGHGLSYTSFEYSDLVIDKSSVSFIITNTGAYCAKETAQLYIAPPHEGSYRPAMELKGFAKVTLRPGESKEVTLALDERTFAMWQDDWVTPQGNYGILIGGSSADIRLRGEIAVNGIALDISAPDWYQKPAGAPSHVGWEKLIGRRVQETQQQKGQFTMDNTVMEMKEHSFVMKVMYKAIEATIAKGFGGKRDFTNPKFRMMMNSAADASLSGMKISGGMRNYVLEGMLEVANGHFFKGIGRMLMKAK